MSQQRKWKARLTIEAKEQQERDKAIEALEEAVRRVIIVSIAVCCFSQGFFFFFFF